MGASRISWVAGQETLEKLGLSFTALSLEETTKLRDRWRRVFARPLYRSQGLWHRGRYDWHVFSFQDTYALAKDAALDAYRAESCSELVLLPNDKHDRACKVQTDQVPELKESDVYVFPPDLSWTMVYTNEDGWYGPYFSRSAWIDTPPLPDPSHPKKRRKKRRGSRR